MRWKLSLREPAQLKTALWFLVLSCVGTIFVFRGAIWGEAILVPLDIPATLFSKYRWIDPNLGDVPRSHWLVDMFDYGVPRMYLAHRSIQAGEFPWWDPYSAGGRPLVTEAHMSMSDPIRLVLFRFLPFVAAYNWAHIIHSLLAGLFMFILLRFFGFSQFATVLGALSFQFSGLQSLFFYPENVPNSLLYYPLLWLALAKFSTSRPLVGIALGGPLCAAILLAGNPQSHAYLVLFLLCFALGYGSCLRAKIVTVLMVTGGAFLLGCLLAAPVWVPQLELFALSSRETQLIRLGKQLFTGVFSVAGVFPWVTGSNRSIDLGKLVENYGAAYAVHLGTPVMMIALIGMLGWRRSSRAARPETRTAFLLVLVYFLGVCSTPLVNILYHRAAGLAVLGLTVMFATGLQVLVENSLRWSDRILRWTAVVLAVVVVFAHLFAFMLYPSLKERVLKVALQIDAKNITMPSIPQVRHFQVNNLPNDITFKNPAAVLAFIGAFSLLLISSTSPIWRQISWVTAFVLNLIPLLMLFNRTIPYSPIKYWNDQLAGGPEQQRIVKLLGSDLRLREQSRVKLDFVFPGSTAIYYGVHTLLDYSSFPLTAPGQSKSPRDYNLLYASPPQTAAGEIVEFKTNQVRFIWGDGSSRDVQILRETPNSIQLRIAAGAPGQLIRTDTYYPGWRVERPDSVALSRNADGFLAFAIPPEATDLVLRYRPAYSHITNPISFAALVATAALLLVSMRKRAEDRLKSAESIALSDVG